MTKSKSDIRPTEPEERDEESESRLASKAYDLRPRSCQAEDVEDHLGEKGEGSDEGVVCVCRGFRSEQADLSVHLQIKILSSRKLASRLGNMRHDYDSRISRRERRYQGRLQSR